MAEAGGAGASGMVPVPCGELLALAAANEAAARLDDAGRVLGHVLAAQPHNPHALHLLSVVAFRHGRLQRAPA
jgi:cytochrome c-type biogenesis protein CcmH/NrfG